MQNEANTVALKIAVFQHAIPACISAQTIFQKRIAQCRGPRIADEGGINLIHTLHPETAHFA